MNREEIDIMWNKALQQAIKDGEEFTRYHFAELVAADVRKACAKVCKEHFYAYQAYDAIQARGQA